MSHSPSSSAPSTRRHAGALARLTRACARHPWRTVFTWLGIVVAIFAASGTVGGTLVNEFKLPDSDAQRATDLLTTRFPQRSGDAATLVFEASDGGRLTSGAGQEAVRRALAAADRVPGVVAVGDPFKGRDGGVGKAGDIAYADAQFNRQGFDIPSKDTKRLKDDARRAVEGSGVRVEFTGAAIQEPPETGASEGLGLLAAIVVLLVVFGTVVAAVLPIVLALVSLGTAFALLTLAAAVTNFNTITPVLLSMIGLGVGIDYALFIVTRFRQALHDRLEPVDAAAVAGATAGRAVIFAGLTVAISISGLAVIGLDFVTKLGLGAAIGVVVSVCTATTLLPAILRLLGRRIDRLRVAPTRDDSTAARHDTFVARWGRRVTSHPGVAIAVALAVLVLAALPVATARLGASDNGSAPKSATTRQAYDLLARGFGPGFNGPLLVAVDTAGDRAAPARLADAFRRTPDVAFVPEPVLNGRGDAGIVTVFPRTEPQSSKTQDLVERLRDDTIPATLGGTSSVKAYVGGSTAAFDDIASRIASRMPLFLLVVVGITFLVLTMAFRSVVIALKAALATILSSLAAFGVLVLVFQHGYGMGLVGLDRAGPIESFLPVIVFAIVFGLSMDYEVFLVSRMREEYVHGDSPRGAIRHGMSAVGRVIVAAAAIMSVVFFAFLLGPDRTTKEFGLALGTAIVFDAFVVRLTLVPALMHLLDGRAWYIPRWLDRVLPRLTVEAPRDTIAAATDGRVLDEAAQTTAGSSR